MSRPCWNSFLLSSSDESWPAKLQTWLTSSAKSATSVRWRPRFLESTREKINSTKFETHDRFVSKVKSSQVAFNWRVTSTQSYNKTIDKIMSSIYKMYMYIRMYTHNTTNIKLCNICQKTGVPSALWKMNSPIMAITNYGDINTSPLAPIRDGRTSVLTWMTTERRSRAKQVEK